MKPKRNGRIFILLAAVLLFIAAAVLSFSNPVRLSNAAIIWSATAVRMNTEI